MNLTALNQSCTNFDALNCGNFRTQLIHERYADQTKQGTKLNFLSYQLANFFDTFQGKTNVSKFAKKFYNLCMNEARIKKSGYKPVLDMIDKIGGLNKQIFNSNWEDLHNLLLRTGLTKDILIRVWLDPRPETPSIYSIFVGSQNWHILGGKLRDFLKINESDNILNYYTYIKDTYKMLYDDEVDIEHQSSINETFQFEKLLIRALHENEDERKDDEQKVYTIKELQNQFPFMNWMNFFKARFGMHENEFFEETTEVTVVDDNLIKNLNNFMILKNDSIIQDYLRWKFVDQITVLLPRKLKTARSKFYKDVYLIERFPEQWSTCILETSKLFPIVVADIYGQYFRTKFDEFPSKTRDKTFESLVKSIKTEIKKVLKEKYLNLNHENVATLSKYIDEFKIISPIEDDLFSRNRVEDYYKEIDTNFSNSDDYYSIIQKMRRFKVRRVGILRYNQQVENTLWEAHLDIIDDKAIGSFIISHYDIDKKYFYLGPNDLTPPNFDISYPDYLNYAGVGFEISRTIVKLVLKYVSFSKQNYNSTKLGTNNFND